VQTQSVDRHKADLARLGRLRDVVDAQSGGEGFLAPGEGFGNRSFEIFVRVRIALQHPDARGIDRQQQIAVGLQMEGARIWRRGDEIDRARPARVADIGDRKAVAEHMADIGMPLMDHDLHAIAAAVLVGMAHKFDVARRNREHAVFPLCDGHIIRSAGRFHRARGRGLRGQPA
jgi:hypothetical protein